MADNIFNDSAWYLYTYTGTRSHDRWSSTLKKTWEELKNELGGSQPATELLTKMVAYYCLEVGASYKGDVAASKFRRVYRWPDFKDAFLDKDQALVLRWREMRSMDKIVQGKRKELSSFGVHPSMIVHEPSSREALRTLLAEIERRHGKEHALVSEPWCKELISIYGPTPIMALAHRPHINNNFYGFSKLMDKELIPNMLTSFFIERLIVETYGENLVSMKKRALEVENGSIKVS